MICVKAQVNTPTHPLELGRGARPLSTLMPGTIPWAISISLIFLPLLQDWYSVSSKRIAPDMYWPRPFAYVCVCARACVCLYIVCVYCVCVCMCVFVCG